MKILKIGTLYFMTVLIGGIMSCSKDDGDDDTKDNVITFDGKEYT